MSALPRHPDELNTEACEASSCSRKVVAAVAVAVAVVVAVVAAAAAEVAAVVVVAVALCRNSYWAPWKFVVAVVVVVAVAVVLQLLPRLLLHPPLPVSCQECYYEKKGRGAAAVLAAKTVMA